MTEDETPLSQFVRHWMNERHAPDILPAQEIILNHLLDHLRRQVRTSCNVFDFNNGYLTPAFQINDQ